jgi:cytoskeletal protein RodZ
MKAKNKKNRSKLIWGAIIIAILLCFAATLFLTQRKPATTDPSKVNGGEKAFDSKKDSEQAIRDKSATPTPSSTSATSPKKTLKPTIIGVDGDSSSAATSITVDALPDGATSGTCTFTITQNGIVRTATTSITSVTSYYACGTGRIDKAQLTNGSATLTVSVDSPSGTGVSDQRSITITK